MNYLFEDYTKNLEERLNSLVDELTLEEKIGLMSTNQRAIPRLGIREFIVGGEAAHGIAWLGKATCFPQPIGLSSTWNRELMLQIGDAIGNEARVFYKKFDRKKGLTLWAPTVDLLRDPRWGRTEEGYGEDPYLTGVLCRSLVEGMQGKDRFYKKTLSTIKHFMGNNNELDRLFSSSNIDNRNKYEYYIKPFKYLIEDDGAFSIMPAYNSVNNLPCILDSDLQKIIKKEWNLKGFIVGDAGDMAMLVDHHKYFDSYAKAVAAVIKSGVDSVNDDGELVENSLKEAINEGLLKEPDLDQAIKNVFRGRFKIGEFDPDHLNPYAIIDEEVLCCTKHNQLSLKAAKEAVVLLKNENNLLPLNQKKIKKIAVLGPLSNILYRDWYSGEFPYTVTPLEGIKKYCKETEILFHNSSDLIAIRSKRTGKYLSVDEKDGTIKAEGLRISDNEVFEVTNWGWGSSTIKSSYNKRFFTVQKGTIVASAEEVFGWFVREKFNLTRNSKGYIFQAWNGKNLTILDGELKVGDSSDSEEEYFDIILLSSAVEEAQKIAKKSDIVVFFAGNNPVINGKEDEDRPGLSLPQLQEELISSIYEVNKNIVVNIVGSYPFAIDEISKYVPSIIYTSHGSQELGHALADVIFGTYNPSGKLTMTWYKNEKDFENIKNYDIIKGKRTYLYYEKDCLYPFGHGMTYTSFHYKNMCTSINIFTQKIQVKFELENKGEIPGEEVVQLYVSCHEFSIQRPIKELKAFEKVHLFPNETKKILFELSIKDINYWDVVNERYSIGTGTYNILLGSSSKDIRLINSVKIEGDELKNRDFSSGVKAENYDDYNNVTLQKDINGLQVIYAEKENAWISFQMCDFTNARGFEVKVKSTHAHAIIKLISEKISGNIIGEIELNKFDEWEIFQFNIKENLNQTYDQIYISLSKGISLEWIRLI